MPRTRRPVTAEEVQEFFEMLPADTAELMIRLISASLKRRRGAPSTSPKSRTKAATTPTPGPTTVSA